MIAQEWLPFCDDSSAYFEQMAECLIEVAFETEVLRNSPVGISRLRCVV